MTRFILVVGVSSDPESVWSVEPMCGTWRQLLRVTLGALPGPCEQPTRLQRHRQTRLCPTGKKYSYLIFQLLPSHRVW